METYFVNSQCFLLFGGICACIHDVSCYQDTFCLCSKSTWTTCTRNKVFTFNCRSFSVLLALLYQHLALLAVINMLHAIIVCTVHLISRRLRGVGNVARMEEDRSAFNILTGKPTGKRPLGKTILDWTLKR